MIAPAVRPAARFGHQRPGKDMLAALGQVDVEPGREAAARIPCSAAHGRGAEHHICYRTLAMTPVRVKARVQASHAAAEVMGRR
jgi:hypothetical protein